MTEPQPTRPRLTRAEIFLCLLPVLATLFVWFTALAFFPTPWPDDAAFYFPAKDLFAWPPRWVMIPQSPFEPTYRIWNFNTMPLYPILIGLGRFIGVDGSFALKIYPLASYAATASLIVLLLVRLRAPLWIAAAFSLLLSFDPILHWGAVIVRPESLIGLCAVAILYGEVMGYPQAFRERKFFHPAAALLAVAAYAHFNAIYAALPIALFFVPRPKKLLKVGALTFVFLIPWLATAATHFWIFVAQMQLQFNRLLNYRNPWLDSWDKTLGALLPEMGNPEGWPSAVRFTGPALAALILLALAAPLALWVYRRARKREDFSVSGFPTVVSAAWLLATLVLWHKKAEVWFIYYIHLALITTWALFLTWVTRLSPNLRRFAWALALPFLMLSGAYAYNRFETAYRLGQTRTWHWDTYDAYVDCIDRYLVAESARYGDPEKFEVWAPTFPDVLIELSRRHPKWEFTRTNDFFVRNQKAIQHGYRVPAIVTTEVFHRTEFDFTGPAREAPDLQSVWMTWDGYYLHQFLKDKAFKPRRFVCKRARWEAYLYFME